MNYRHAYHAGNFADVFKHCVLVALLEALKAKSKPLCYIDTHAGAGRYDLACEAARKTAEADQGIARVRGKSAESALLARYLALVEAEEPGFYPGSPRLAAALLRENDCAQLCELHPEEATILRALVRNDPRIHVHQRDGYAALKALLPPRERRGLVLIDPPFEAQDQEFKHIRTAVEAGMQRWPKGVYAIWYPIKLARDVQPFRRWLHDCPARTVLDVELLVQSDTVPRRLNGAGMAILNPPWKLDHRLAELLPLLARTLATSPGTGKSRLQWLKTEARP
ncbi:23S rRNA (adenine(2030)-N(6))-methyltransferase RlmJ [Oleiagrimonas sp.]|jgi:23S rRNA (adenine2030-N6)-methyltransferase|uniref:23S rRNA (adenine(2030)-N(6))-methyltransferase RlmJ n=1 Tax=Oleiagrimonas sp. TaxID=2010330 RepID=UPI002602A130|nr:23S rRNA (adenine(2030)-N(6))-methyltransferase RlmJ [Oleiagrimonas sp.]MDA3914428.1 23S rRNA (adenine(2030)-N(6))-methyltransferase RlmJ [Oleiagrimonas sp.]